MKQYKKLYKENDQAPRNIQTAKTNSEVETDNQI